MVLFLDYNKKKYPVKAGYYAIKKLQTDKKKSMVDMQTDVSLYEPFLFYSLQKGAELEGQKLDLTLKDMPVMLEDVYMKFVQMIPKFFPPEDVK